MSYEGWYPALPVPIGAPMYVGGEMENYVGFNDFQTTGKRSGDNQSSVITSSTDKYGTSSGYRINNSRNPFNWLPYGLTNAFAPDDNGNQPKVDSTELGNDQLCWYPSQTEYSTIDSTIAIGLQIIKDTLYNTRMDMQQSVSQQTIIQGGIFY